MMSRLTLALFFFFILFSIPLLRYSLDRIRNEAAMRSEYERLKLEVDRSERCLAQMESALVYVRSDRYVEEWARGRERLGKSGDVVIVPYMASPLVREAQLWWEDKVNCQE